MCTSLSRCMKNDAQYLRAGRSPQLIHREPCPISSTVFLPMPRTTHFRCRTRMRCLRHLIPFPPVIRPCVIGLLHSLYLPRPVSSPIPQCHTPRGITASAIVSQQYHVYCWQHLHHRYHIRPLPPPHIACHHIIQLVTMAFLTIPFLDMSRVVVGPSMSPPGIFGRDE